MLGYHVAACRKIKFAAAILRAHRLAPALLGTTHFVIKTCAVLGRTVPKAAQLGRASREVRDSSAAMSAEALVDLGELVEGALVKRPSASCKTPYVADVQLPDGRMVMAHAPAMDCAGMVVPGSAVYMTQNAPKPGGSSGVTSHAIQVVADMRPPGSGAASGSGGQASSSSNGVRGVAGGDSALVGYHPQLAERIAVQALARGLLEPFLGAHVRLEAQKTFGSTRVDFLLHHQDGSCTLLEVKNVVCADYPEGGVPPGRPKVGVYTVPAQGPGGRPYQPSALFPHGAAKPGIKVVSDRAIKHLHELTLIQRAGGVPAALLGPPPSAQKKKGRKRLAQAEDEGDGGADDAKATSPAVATSPAAADTSLAAGAGGPGQQVPARCAVLFVVNRSDCASFRPCHEADMLFAQVLRHAQEAGVRVLAHDVEWRLDGRARWGKPLPVLYGEGVSGEYDPQRLQAVLEFNATDPRKHWKKDAAAAGKKGGAAVAGKTAAGQKATGKKAAGKKAASDEDTGRSDGMDACAEDEEMKEEEGQGREAKGPAGGAAKHGKRPARTAAPTAAVTNAAAAAAEEPAGAAAGSKAAGRPKRAAKAAATSGPPAKRQAPARRRAAANNDTR